MLFPHPWMLMVVFGPVVSVGRRCQGKVLPGRDRKTLLRSLKMLTKQEAVKGRSSQSQTVHYCAPRYRRGPHETLDRIR